MTNFRPSRSPFNWQPHLECGKSLFIMFVKYQRWRAHQHLFSNWHLVWVELHPYLYCYFGANTSVNCLAPNISLRCRALVFVSYLFVWQYDHSNISLIWDLEHLHSSYIQYISKIKDSSTFTYQQLISHMSSKMHLYSYPWF